MNSIPIGISRTIWLLLRLQALRFQRQLSGGLSVFRKKDATQKRAATPAKKRQGLLLGVLVGLSVALTFTNISYQSVSNIKETVGSTIVRVAPVATKAVNGAKPQAAPRQQATTRVFAAPAPGFALASSVLNTVAFQALLFLIAVSLLTVGNGDLIKPDWDLEWLVTLPATLSTLMITRIFARTALNPIGLYLILPFLTVVAWESGYRFSAPLVALAVALPLFLIIASIQTLADTGFRLRLGPPQLRNLQAFLSIISVGVLFLAMSPGMPAKGAMVMSWASSMPQWTLWLPAGLAIDALASATPLHTAKSIGLLAVEAAFFASLVVWFLRLELRGGVVAGGGRETGRREQVKRRAKAASKPGNRFLLTPIQARELRLLGRDRAFLVQTLIMPIVLVGIQVITNGGGASLFTSVNSHPEYLASIAFGISAYALMFSAFQILNAEGQALWILYTVPQSIESILKQKAALWGVTSLIYPITLFGIALAVQGPPPFEFAEFAVLVFIGVPIFAVIATSLGVFACDPLAQDVQRRVKVSYTYLYLLLSSTYIYSVYANTIWQRLSLLTLITMLAFALWQKARDHLPFLLDPAKAPPARVSISDGLIAALLFFVLQGVVTLFRLDPPHHLTGFDVLIAFSTAGALTYGVMRLSFWRQKSEGVPRTFGPNMPTALAFGILAGAAAAGFAFVYLKLAMHTQLFEKAQETLLLGQSDRVLIAVLAIVAAPVFEEFIFRGLIFGGLRRSMGLTASVFASAAIFAIVHPPVSVIPVFGLGLVTAFIYERTKLLIAPMTAHAVYNGFIVGFQFIL